MTADHSLAFTIRDYAAAVNLPLEWVESELGLRHVHIPGAAVAVDWRSAADVKLGTQFITSGTDPHQVVWKSGTRLGSLGLYGEDRLGGGSDSVVVVEGAVGCHILWYHRIRTVGVPTWAAWRPGWETTFSQYERIYVLGGEPGSDGLMSQLLAAGLGERVRLVSLEPHGDLAEMQRALPADGEARLFIEGALARAMDLDAHEAEQLEVESAAAWEVCEQLATTDRILDRFVMDIRTTGVVGEERMVILLFLAMTSRLFEKPVSLAVKGTSASGKSFATDTVLGFFPPEAYLRLTSMSEKALIYTDEDLRHRVIVMAEAEGISRSFTDYIFRSLLSDGRLLYQTTVKDPATGDFGVQKIEKEGPTGLVVTTTAVSLHAENETRLISITSDDSGEQTKRVLQAVAAHAGPVPAGFFDEWWALQRWLAARPIQVVVPFAADLASAVPAVAVRLRRDFQQVLSLIRAHALLHRATREIDDQGRVVATVDDYRVVHELMAAAIAEGVAESVPASVRETVEAVAHLAGSGPVTVKALAEHLGLDQSTVRRRVNVCEADGYLAVKVGANNAKLIAVGEPLPTDAEVLPDPDAYPWQPDGPGNEPPPGEKGEGDENLTVPHDTHGRTADHDPRRGGRARQAPPAETAPPLSPRSNRQQTRTPSTAGPKPRTRGSELRSVQVRRGRG